MANWAVTPMAAGRALVARTEKLGVSGKITAVVAESLPVFREALVRALTYDLGADVADSVQNVEDVLELIKAAHPDLAVIDRGLPGRDTLEALSLARQWST